MRTFTGLDLAFKLLKGEVSGAELETLLSNPLYLGPWRELMKTTELNALMANSNAITSIMLSDIAAELLFNVAGERIANSDAITELITNNSSLIASVLSSSEKLHYWDATTENTDRLRARVNAPGSKLNRWVFNTSGTFSKPSGLILLSAAACGLGGSGSQGDIVSTGIRQTAGGAGGGGGEIKTKLFSDAEILAMPASVSITIPAIGSGSNTVVDGYLTALPGSNAVGGDGNNNMFTAPTLGAGSGTDNNRTLIRADLQNEVFQIATASAKGGDGGRHGHFSNTSVLTEANPGQNGIFGAGGSPGISTNGSNNGTAGFAGTGYGSGGGGGGTSNNTGTTPVGQNATNPGCGGGGAYGYSASNTGGAGGPGQVIFYGVIE